MQLDQGCYRQQRLGDPSHVFCCGLRHPYGYGQRCSIGSMYNIGILPIHLVLFDDGDPLSAQWMQGVMDRDFSNATALGSMSLCSFATSRPLLAWKTSAA